MNPKLRKPRAPMAAVLDRFSRPTHSSAPRPRQPHAPRTTAAQAVKGAELREELVRQMVANGASQEVIAVVDGHFQNIIELNAQAASKQAMAENARQRLMGALRFAVGANPEGASLLRAEQERKLKEIAELQSTLATREEQLQTLASGQTGRYFKSLGDSLCNDTRELLNRINAYESALESGNPVVARSVISGLRTLCENLSEFGENCYAYADTPQA